MEKKDNENQRHCCPRHSYLFWLSPGVGFSKKKVWAVPSAVLSLLLAFSGTASAQGGNAALGGAVEDAVESAHPGGDDLGEKRRYGRHCEADHE